eukprot:CAMPEP_0114555536 /NCGR_PEP_ID=MMETSP0114-20121206/8803_1 /TAXON_ID=31324 /ORGANISM="Goniomonas sp, Strain m" /LENGTH=254 /DNA_ID=CAMNT_0001740671 /DNA_START=18 /DNA_END=778 /DNA_ORIENTATION=-
MTQQTLSWADRLRPTVAQSAQPSQVSEPVKEQPQHQGQPPRTLPSPQPPVHTSNVSWADRARHACPVQPQDSLPDSRDAKTSGRPAAAAPASSDEADWSVAGAGASARTRADADWVNIEVTFRPDVELDQPAGCSWLERVVIPVCLRWDGQRLKRELENTVRRRLCEKASQVSAAEAQRGQEARVWGIRAVDVLMPDGRKHMQLHDRECPWKVDMPWEEFLSKLPPQYKLQKQRQKGKSGKHFAFGLYLAYDWG